MIGMHLSFVRHLTEDSDELLRPELRLLDVRLLFDPPEPFELFDPLLPLDPFELPMDEERLLLEERDDTDDVFDPVLPLLTVLPPDD